MTVDGSFTVSVVDCDFFDYRIRWNIEFVIGGTDCTWSVFVECFGSDLSSDCVGCATCVFYIIQTSECYIVSSTGLCGGVRGFCLGFHFSPLYILKFCSYKSWVLGRRSFVTEIFVIRDASYYNPNVVSSATSFSDMDLPSNFKATYTIKRANGQGGWIEIGQNSSNLIFFGVDSGNGNIAIYIRVNGNYQTYQRSGNNVISANTDTVIEYINNNGSQSITANGTTVNLTNNTITSRNYLNYNATNGTSIKELLIMPL